MFSAACDLTPRTAIFADFGVIPKFGCGNAYRSLHAGRSGAAGVYLSARLVD